MGFLTTKERYGIIIMENEKRYIVLQYPLGELDINQVYEIHQNIHEIVARYGLDVLSIPSCVSWCEMSAEELQQVKGLIDFLLEKKNDTDSETGTGT